MNLLTNKYVLYFIALLSIINILSYFFQAKFGAIGFFALVAFLMFYFTPNLTIVLGISLLATNLLGVLAELFTPVKLFSNNNNNNTKKESFVNKQDKKSQEESEKDNISGAILGDKSLQTPFSNNENIDQTTQMSQKAGNLQKNQEINDFLQSNITAKNIDSIQQKTNALLNEQNKMMAQISDLGPILNQSLQAIGNVSTGNIGGTIKTLTQNLDSLYDKYPDAFPENYKDTKIELNQRIDDVGKLNQKIKEFSDENPQAKPQIDDFKNKMGI